MKETKIMEGTYDCIFKAIMLDKENIDYLKTIISIITKIEMKDLKNIIVENIEHNITHRTDKRIKSDIIVTVDNHIINIEMNKDYYEGIIEKNSIYHHKIMGEQMIVNENYLELKKVFQINFDCYSKFKGKKEVYEFIQKEKDTNEILNNNFIEYHIDLAYIKEKCYDKPVDNLSMLERYCLLLLAETKEYAHKLIGDDNIMKKTVNKLESLNSDKKMIGLYDAERQERMINNTKMLYAEKVGLERGIEKGIEKGIKLGVSEYKKELIKNMINQNIDCDTISRLTNIPLEEIKEMINE